MLPAAVELDPPIDRLEADAYYEALEGMVVQVTAPALAGRSGMKPFWMQIIFAHHIVEHNTCTRHEVS